jgi:ribose 5-phosphate isomerase
MDGDKPYVTDNSNYIIDLYFKVLCQFMLENHDLVFS